MDWRLMIIFEALAIGVIFAGIYAITIVILFHKFNIIIIDEKFLVTHSGDIYSAFIMKKRDGQWELYCKDKDGAHLWLPVHKFRECVRLLELTKTQI